MKAIKIILALLVLAFIGIQFKPVDRSNAEPTGEIEAPDEVMAILRRSCYDCHSTETKWPWYAYVAPVSWRIAHDVEEAREHLNFSTWDAYDRGKQIHKLEEVIEEVEEGEMPLANYLRIHDEAKVSSEELEVLEAWVLSMGGGLGHEDVEDEHHDH